MPHAITLPFHVFRLRLHGGAELSVPLVREPVVRIGQSTPEIGQAFGRALEKQLLNKGMQSQLLDEYVASGFEQEVIDVHFAADKEGIRFPSFTLSFDYFYLDTDSGFWGVLPALGLEAFGDFFVDMEDNLRDTILLDFKRNKRLRATQDILSTIWFEGVTLDHSTITVKSPSPRELEGLMHQREEQWLQRVAILLNIKSQESYGREKELSELEKIIKGRFQRSVLLVGPTGVGKTALVWEMARRLRREESTLEIWETAASVLIKELMRDTGWQENLSQLCEELSGGQQLLFVRNLMDLFEVGKSEGNSISMAEYLRPFIASGRLVVITECTADELARITVKAPNFVPLFQRIELEVPPVPELEDIIHAKAQAMVKARLRSISGAATQEALRLNQRFMPYSGLPGQPIRFLETLLLDQRAPDHIDLATVIQHFCQETGIPRFMIDPDVPLDLATVAKDFNEQVFGQEEAVEQVTNVIATVKAALSRTGRPIASFLFVGPTGVGKTELAKVLAQFMFGSRDRMTRFDMSEFSTPPDVQRLIGLGNEGLLTTAIRKAPFGLLLFDEIEKADVSFFDLLLPLLSEGRLTDSQGQLTNFCSTIIIMTSNIGAKALSQETIGWQKQSSDQTIKNHFLAEVRKHFKPELFNRIDQTIPFAPLNLLTVRYVVEREIEHIRNREGVRFRRMSLQIKEEVLDYLAQSGYSHQYGARYLQRHIRETLLIPLARCLNQQDIDDQLHVVISLDGQKIDIQADADPLGLELLLEEYSKIQYADQASALRRRIGSLMDSLFYVKLLNELDLLEQQKKEQQDEFWKMPQQAAQYAYYLDTREAVESLFRETEKMESQMGLSCVQAGSYSTQWKDDIELLEQRFFQLKTQLYSQLNPKDNQCYLGIYGRAAERIITFYLSLFEALEMEVTGHLLWYGTASDGSISSNSEEGAIPQKPKQYTKQPLHAGANIDKMAKLAGGVLWGAELKVTSPCAWLYLQKEGGIQKWIIDDEDYRYKVLVEQSPFETPTKIRRKEFYTAQNARRVVSDQQARDYIYDLNREYGSEELVDLIVPLLRERFRQHIEQETF